ncbi:MAG: hypothetical protein EXS37_04270 [Opitutus sp.]|nr:hypothetical protein [Opitutus sp.]
MAGPPLWLNPRKHEGAARGNFSERKDRRAHGFPSLWPRWIGRWRSAARCEAEARVNLLMATTNFVIKPFVIFLWFCVCVRAEILLQEKVELLAVPHQGPFVRADDGAIWGMDQHGALVSRDEGKSWEARAIFAPERFQPSGERALLRTKEGVMLYAFLNRRELVFKWDDKKGGPQEGCRVPVYLSRSANDGRTWAEPVLLQEGWCGAVRQMIQLRTGRILLIAQKAVANPGRHVTVNYTSDDLGVTWQAGKAIDLGEYGGYGDHGGGLEGTVLEKQNGELKLLLRVPQGCFQEVVSKDGVAWGTPFPSTIAASDSPGMMQRLASGRVVLLWNRYRDPAKKLGRREELSIAFSDSDGLTWTTPTVIAMNHATPGKKESAFWLSYPYVFEPKPGRLWVSTMQGNLRVALNEADFLTPAAAPLDGPAARIIVLGDSITKGVRPGVKPTQTFGALVQAALREQGVFNHVHNVGIGGERTDQALLRLEAEVISQRPHVVTVMYGTNDSWVDEGKTESRLAERPFEENLREIVRRLQAAKIKVVLMTEPKFGEQNRRNGLGEEPNIRLARYMDLCRKVARDTGVTLVDHFADWGTEQSGGRILQAWTTDGCHPNVEGHVAMARRVAERVGPLLR